MSDVKAGRDHLMDAMLKATLDQEDLGEWEDERLRKKWLAAAANELVERLTARSESLELALALANIRIVELKEENAELKGLLGEKRPQMRMINFRVTEEDETLLSIIARRLHRTRSDALRQLVRAAAADPQLHDYMTKRIAAAEGEVE